MIEPQEPAPLTRGGCLFVIVVGAACWAVLVLAGIGAWVVVRALWP